MTPRTEALLRVHPVFDGHNDLPWELREQVGYDFDRLDVAHRVATTQTDLPRLRAGGVGAQFWSVFVPSTLTPAAAVVATLEQISAVRELTRRYSDDLALATTVEQVEAAWAGGRVASLMGAEGGHSIGDSLGALHALHTLGVRYLTLTHNDNCAWADSATDTPRWGGLSPFGHEVVRELNWLGMLVDLSHVSVDTMRAALATSVAPVIFSHSSARALCDHPRNIPDDILASLPANGGVAMVTFVPKFVSPAVREWDLEASAAAVAAGVRPADYTAYTEFCAQRQRTHPAPRATLADVVAHVEHVREVAGIAHVGLGGDYDGVDVQPVGLDDVSGYPRLLAALADRGWSDGELAALTCRNVLRVLGDATVVAAGCQAQRGPSTARLEDLDGPAHAPASA